MKEKFIKKPKHLLRVLKREAKKLPEETYFAIDLYYQPKWDDASGEWKRGIVTEHKVNHGRRIKKLLNKYGMTAVNAYFFVKGNLVQKPEIKQNEETIS